MDVPNTNAATLGVVVLGCGKAGRAQIAWFRADSRAQILAVWNRTRATATSVASEVGCEVLDDWRDALRVPGVGLVTLCGPSSTRAEQALPFLVAGIPVLSEKPMARTHAECVTMVDAARTAGTPLFCAFNMRFHPVAEAVGASIGTIGAPISVDIAYTQHRQSVTWRHRADQGGGVIKEQAVHIFDLLLQWLGPVVEVAAMTLIVNSEREVEDQGDVLLRFATGAVARVHASYNDPRPELMTAAIVGTGGRIDFTLSPYEPSVNAVTITTLNGTRAIPLRPSDTIDPIYPGLLDATRRLIRFVVDRALDRGPAWIDGEAGRATMEIVAGAYASDQRGQTISLPLEVPEAPDEGWRSRRLS